jgi:high-affinity nickel-transport protein
MLTLLSIMTLGFFLGMRHATDPDHVVAVTTIVSRERTVLHAAIIGALWGVGHTLTILVVGSAMILFKISIPPRLGLSMELSVGFMLIFLGILNLTGILQRAMEWISIRWPGSGEHAHFLMGRWMVHAHEEDGELISGESFSLPGWTVLPEQNEEESEGETEPALSQSGLCFPPQGKKIGPGFWSKLSTFHIVRPLLVGIVHGLAGSAAVALLVMATIGRPSWAIGYLLIFGMGTVAGMMLITAVIALPFAYSLQNFMQLNRGLTMFTGFVSVAFGLFLCYQIGFVDGLFSRHPMWIPR